MGEQADGATGSAEAPDQSDSSGQKGFLGRILKAFAPSGDAGQEGGGDRPAGSPAGPLVLPGMGNLRRMRVDDVAIPKVEIVAVPVTISMEDLVAEFKKAGFSRLPVYKGSLDHPLGLIHLKDLALYSFADPKPRFSLRKMLRPLLYVPPFMTIGVLLQKMQSERIHMALVIDEYGGVDGLVTLEDLIEQVIGEIDDEHDEDEDKDWIEEKPGQYLVQARASLEAFAAETGVRLVDEDESEEIDTLGGLIFMLAGRVPARGEVIEHASGAAFEIVEADPRRIKRLRVRLPRQGE